MATGVTGGPGRPETSESEDGNTAKAGWKLTALQDAPLDGPSFLLVAATNAIGCVASRLRLRKLRKSAE